MTPAEQMLVRAKEDAVTTLSFGIATALPSLIDASMAVLFLRNHGQLLLTDKEQFALSQKLIAMRENISFVENTILAKPKA